MFSLSLKSLKLVSSRSLAIWFACLLVLPAQANELSPENLIQRTIINHPRVRSAEEVVNARDQSLAAAKLSRFPALTVDSSYTNLGPTAAIDLQQPIWTAGSVEANVRRARFDSFAAKADVETQRYNLSVSTIDAWEELMQSLELQQIYRSSLMELDRFEQMINRRVESQVSARIELDLIMNRILQTEDALRTAEQREQIALERLAQLVGAPIGDGALASRQSLDPLVSYVKAQSRSLDPLQIATQVQQHPLVVQSRYQKRAAEESVTVEEARKWPQLVARYRHEYIQSIEEDRDTVSVGFQYAPGAGFSNYALAKAQAAQARSLEFDTEATRRDLVETLLVEYQIMESAIGRIDALKKAVEGSKVVQDSYERQYIAGRKQWLDLLNALLEVQQYGVDLAQTKVSMIAGYYRVQLGLGQLTWQQTS